MTAARRRILWHSLVVVTMLGAAAYGADAPQERLSVAWANNYLTILGPRLPEAGLRINYLEAYCRPGSTDRVWGDTVIGHKTRLVEADDDGRRVLLKCRLQDGVIVDHEIVAGADEVTFRVTASNATDRESQAHWAQPCVRVPEFTGGDQESYISKCFIFQGGRLQRLPTEPWATEARYVPGQVYRPANVDPDDVNPRPLSTIIPDHGLVGCFSADESSILAMAWEPYQELFQGVIVCIHSDFRIGGLEPGEVKQIRGKLYVVDADVDALTARFAKDFPEQVASESQAP